MNWKEFFKPAKLKILYFFIIFIILFLLYVALWWFLLLGGKLDPTEICCDFVISNPDVTELPFLCEYSEFNTTNKCMQYFNELNYSKILNLISIFSILTLFSYILACILVFEKKKHKK